MEQLNIYDLALMKNKEYRKSEEYLKKRFQIYCNKLKDIEINKNDIMNNFYIVEVDAKGLEAERSNFSIQSIFKKNRDFYKENLLSLDYNFYTKTCYLLLKKGSKNIEEKIRKDCGNEDIVVKKIGKIHSDMDSIILNLFLKATIKMNNKDLNFVNSAYEYIAFVEFLKQKDKEGNPLLINFKGFVPRFRKTKNEHGKDEIYLAYNLRNFRKYETLDEKMQEKRSNYEKIGIYKNDVVGVYNKDESYGPFVMTARAKDKKAGLDEILVESSDSKSLEENIRAMGKTKQMLFHKAAYDMKKFFRDYIDFSFVRFDSDEYKMLHYKKGDKYGYKTSEKYKKRFNEIFAGKKLLLIDTTHNNKDKAEIIKDVFTKKGATKGLELNLSCDISNEYIKGYDYIINLTLDPSIYEDNEQTYGMDPYMSHELKTPIKNFIVNKKMSQKEIRNKVRALALSLMVEEEIINKKTNFLTDDIYQGVISFVMYKNDKYVYQLKIDHGKLSYYIIDEKHTKRIDELGLDSSYELEQIKTYLDLRYDLEKNAPYGQLYNHVKDYNIELYIIQGEFDIANPYNNTILVKRSYLKPIVAPQLYEDIFIDGNIKHKDDMKIEDNDYYPRTLTSKSGRKVLGIRHQNLYQFALQSFLDIKVVDNVYISGYKVEDLNGGFENSAVGRVLVGKNYEKFVETFADELFFEYKSLTNKFTSRPLVYKYLTTLKDIIEEDDLREEAIKNRKKEKEKEDKKENKKDKK